MKRVYLSHPFGKRPENVEKSKRLAEWYQDAWADEGRDYEIVNPLTILAPLSKGIDEWTMLKIAINLMRSCDIVLFAPGWKKSRGCRLEHMAAKGMEVFEIPEGVIVCDGAI